MFYLSSLEKIKDFLSRVAGNVFEILDVSWPLNITVDEFALRGRSAIPSAKVKPGWVRLYVLERLTAAEKKKRGRPVRYPDFQNPLLEYKNMLLCERSSRTTSSP
jgi:hypothetical protein